uniref:Uncharacterized protein n=1 Tax=Plectus sambesii TaxID=2011161 RepID=A0A914UZT5_9BILA
MFVLIIGIARGNVWTCFAEYLNKKSRRRTIGDSVLVLFGAILFIWFNAGMRSQAGAARKRTRLTGNELKLGLNKGTYRISTRDYISAEHANKLNLLNRRVNQADIDKIISYETNFEKIAQQLCEDERMIRFEWSGGVNTLIGGRWKSAKCILEKLDIYDSSELNTRVPSGFALNRDFPQVYRDLLNQIIIRQFYGNQLERAMRRYDLHPLTPGQKEGDLLPDPLSLHLLSHGFIFFVVASSLCVVAIIVELLTLTTIPFDTSNAYRVSTFRPDDLD